MYLNLISQRAKIEGYGFPPLTLRTPPPTDAHPPPVRFIVFDYASQYHIADADLAQWVSDGRLKVRESRLVGLDQCVNGLIGLFRGDNTGKAVVKVGREGVKL